MNPSRLHVTRGFPYGALSSLPNRALIGIGGNIGNVPRRFSHLFLWLRRHARCRVRATSPLYENPPFGYDLQPMFFNAVMELRTSLSYYALFALLRYLERRFGRVKSFKNAPRTLDLDMIAFNDLQIARTHLQIPHPRWRERASVVIPLVWMQGLA